VRRAAYAAVALAVLALAACDGNGNGDGRAAWAGPPEPAADGTVSVDEFVDHQRDVDEPWERSAEMAASEFLRLDERTAVRTTIAGEGAGEGSGPRSVIVTLDGLLDDSVRAERWTLVFEPPRDEGYLLESALRELQCNPGRGHEDFAPEPCL
jgi:hypothetical protein